jgi:hypothetical protein
MPSEQAPDDGLVLLFPFLIQKIIIYENNQKEVYF